MACDCLICQRVRRLEAIMVKLPKEDAEWLDALFEAYLEADADLDWYKAVTDGSWPDAEAVILGWHHKVKAELTPPTGGG